MFNRTILLICLLLSTGSALARPAAWYWWNSRADGQRVCAQTMPDSGWQRVGGPFRDARCRVPDVR